MNMLRLCFFAFCLIMNAAYSGGGTIRQTIPAPEGFTKVHVYDYTYSSWIVNLPLKNGDKIYNFKGERLWTHNFNVLAVVDKPLLYKMDFEHGADYAMRFWTDYHRDLNKLDELYLPDYHGAKNFFNKSGMSVENYLKYVIVVSNAHSIQTGCRQVSPDSLMPGDMIVQRKNGEVGHVSVIMDICYNSAGEKLYLIGFGITPAQDFHIESAGNRYGTGDWFSLDGFYDFLGKLPYNKLGAPVLRRF